MKKHMIATLLLTVLSPAHAQTKPTGKITPPTGKSHRPVGTPAIATNSKNTPPFSLENVTVYLKTHNLPKNGSNSPIQVASLEFLSSAEASKRLQGVSIGLTDTEMVGFATLSGTFQFGYPGAKAPGSRNKAYALFDAISGNLLMIGTF